MKKSELKQLIREILAEAKTQGLSGFKKSPDKKDNTQMGYDDKSITSTDKPTEKKEGKKLPVVQKKSNTETDHLTKEKTTPVVPANEKKEGKALPVGGHGAKGIKEASYDDYNPNDFDDEPKKNYGGARDTKKTSLYPDEDPNLTGGDENESISLKQEIVQMIRETMEEYRKKGDLGRNNAQRTAPVKTYVPKGIPGMGRPKDSEEGQIDSIISVAINGKEVGEFDLNLKTPSGKPDLQANAMKKHVDSFHEKNNLAEYGFLSLKAYEAFDKLSDQWADGALAPNSVLDLKIEQDARSGLQVLVPKNV